jgi:hypothetical protein
MTMSATAASDAGAGAVARLRLPRLAGRRDEVGDLLAAQHVPDDLHDRDLAVLCRDLTAGSASFADELVRVAVEQRGARTLILVGAPERFVAHVRAAGDRRGVPSRVAVRSWAEVPA